MPSTVVANPELAQGGLVLLKHSASHSSDGASTYVADYACLAQFATNHTGKFVKGAPPPIDRPAALARTDVAMDDVTIERINGIVYFRAVYAGADRNVYEESETETLKSFSKTVEQRIPRGNNPANAIIRTYSLSFDYISVTVTTTSKFNWINRRGANSLVSSPRNIVGDVGRVQYRPDAIVLRSLTKGGNGTKTYTLNAQGIYV